MKQAVIAALCLAATACASLEKQTIATPSWASTYAPAEGDTMLRPLSDLLARLRANGVTVEFLDPAEADEELGPRVYAHAHMMGNLIHMRAEASTNAKFEILAHEAGHLFHAPGLADLPVRELFAETVGVGVQEFYGSKTARSSAAGYLAQHKHAFAALPYLKSDIELAIKALTGQVPWPFKPAEPQ